MICNDWEVHSEGRDLVDSDFYDWKLLRFLLSSSRACLHPNL